MAAQIYAGGDPNKVNVAGYTKGDVLAADASGVLQALPVGPDSDVLTADSGAAEGVDWQAGGGGGGGVNTVFGRSGNVVAQVGDYAAFYDSSGAAAAVLASSAQRASNLADLASASSARTNLGLGNSATENVGTTAGTVAAGDDSRIVGAMQKASNLSDVANVATSRTNLGLGGAAVLNVGTSAGTVAAGDDSRIVGALQSANNLSDVANQGTSRTNLGLGSSATRNVGTTAGTVAAGDDSRIVGAQQQSTLTTKGDLYVATASATVVRQGVGSNGSLLTADSTQTNGMRWAQPATPVARDAAILGLQAVTMPWTGINAASLSLTSGLFIAMLVRPGPVVVTNLGVLMHSAGVTTSGVNAMGLYDASGVLIDNTGDMTSLLAGSAPNYIEAAIGTPRTLSDNTNYYFCLLTHFSGTVPKVAGSLVMSVNIPSIKGNVPTIAISTQTNLPASFNPATAAKNNGVYLLGAS